MSIELLRFNFQSIFIRVLLIGDTIWFIASDVAKALGYKDPPKAVTRHCKYANLLKDIDWTFRPVQQNQAFNSLDPKTKIIPEPDLYRLTTKSTFPSAEAFEKWVFQTVIPTIRQKSKEALTPAAQDIITYNGIQFLRHQEEYEVRKGKINTLSFYTQRDTGVSGMSLRSVANGCGVALNALQKLLEEKSLDFFLEVTTKQGDFADNNLIIKEKEVTTKPDDFYLIKTSDIYVILDIYCERILRYYAYESRYKKTKARELHIASTWHGLRNFMQVKTKYDPNWSPLHDKSTISDMDRQFQQRIEELELQVVEQKQTITQLTEENKIFKFKPNNENTYRNLVHSMFGGEREVYIGGVYPGRVDIVTKNMVIEVKRTDEFEQGFGQLQRYCAKLYGTEHKHKLCTLFLYGDISEQERDILQTIAENTNIQLIFYQDIKHHIDQDELELLQQSM